MCKKLITGVILDAGLPLGLSISGMASLLKSSESNEPPESTAVHSNEDDSPTCPGPKVHGLNFFPSPPQHTHPSSPAPHLHHHCAHLVCSAGLIGCLRLLRRVFRPCHSFNQFRQLFFPSALSRRDVVNRVQYTTYYFLFISYH